MTTDTPRTDACSTERERILANALDKAIEMGAKAESEVERLKDELKKGAFVLSTIVTALEDAVPWIRTTLSRD